MSALDDLKREIERLRRELSSLQTDVQFTKRRATALESTSKTHGDTLEDHLDRIDRLDKKKLSDEPGVIKSSHISSGNKSGDLRANTIRIIDTADNFTATTVEDALAEIGSGYPDGSGTADYLARWIDSDTIGVGTSRDDGSAVAIGTAPDSSIAPLHVVKEDSNSAGVSYPLRLTHRILN